MPLSSSLAQSMLSSSTPDWVALRIRRMLKNRAIRGVEAACWLDSLLPPFPAWPHGGVRLAAEAAQVRVDCGGPHTCAR